MAVVMNVSPHVVPLTVGLLAPRASRNIDPSLQLEADLIEDGILVLTDPDQNPPAPITPPGGWQPTKQTPADLPSQGNKHGDVRVARDTLSPFVWNALTTDWEPLTVAVNAAGTMLTFQQPVAGATASVPFPLASGGQITRAFVSIADEADTDVLFDLKINAAHVATLTVPAGDVEADIDLEISLDTGDRPSLARQGVDGGAAFIVLYKAG